MLRLFTGLFFALAVSAFVTSADAAYPMCGPTSSGLCQSSPTDSTVVYGCGDGNYVGSSCGTCGDACFMCSNFSQGCASITNDDEPRRREAHRERTMMVCMPDDAADAS